MPKNSRALRRLQERCSDAGYQAAEARAAGIAVIAEFTRLPKVIVRRLREDDCLAILRQVDVVCAAALGVPLADMPAGTFGFGEAREGAG